MLEDEDFQISVGAAYSNGWHQLKKNFVPLMRDPEMDWKASAIGRFRNGDTIRTDGFRYTEYTHNDGRLTSRMLYDHTIDSQEDANIAEGLKL